MRFTLTNFSRLVYSLLLKPGSNYLQQHSGITLGSWFQSQRFEASGGGAVVEQSTHRHKVKGLSQAVAGTRRESVHKKSRN